jgi:hypothetical protein
MEWRMTGILAQWNTLSKDCGFTWASKKEIKNGYPLPSAYRSYLNHFLSDR